MVSVLVADDHNLLVDGLRLIFEDEGFKVVGVVNTPDEIAAKYFELKPDVLLLDIQFGRTWGANTGLDVCFDLLGQDPSARVLVFSQFDNPYLVKEAYANGALAFVRKDEQLEVLLEAIRSVARGEQFYPEAVATMMAAPQHPGRPVLPPDMLPFDFTPLED